MLLLFTFDCSEYGIGLGPTSDVEGWTSINVYAAEGICIAKAISCDGCIPEGNAAGTDLAIDAVAAKTDVSDSLLACPGSIEGSLLG